jgi:hypothetical protein
VTFLTSLSPTSSFLAGKVNPQVTLATLQVNYALTGDAAAEAVKQHVWLDLVDAKHPDFTTVASLNAGESVDISVFSLLVCDPHLQRGHSSNSTRYVRSCCECEGKNQSAHGLSLVFVCAGSERGLTHCCLFVCYILYAGSTATVGAEGDKMDYYIGRVGWWEDGSVMVQVHTRYD